MNTRPQESQRFQSGANQYAEYLKTPEGRLRSDLAYANLEDFLPRPGLRSLCALDIGGGTGENALRLARLGIHVTLLDSSPEMLDISERAARQAGLSEQVAFKHGDAVQLASLFEARTFDVILCHNVLEYVEDPESVLLGAARALRDSSAVLSALVRNQAGEVLKAALHSGDLASAEQALNAEWGHESLYGGQVRILRPDTLASMLKAAALEIFAERGVRVISDYLPSRISRDAEYARIFDFERKLGSRPEFAAIARYLQCFAHLP